VAPGTPQSAPHESATLSGTERDARIEQLLLAGLDEYFAGRYEPAINLWTRVLFLDRHHDRARAYIERARSAQAELQRESEAMLQQGMKAFAEGDVVRARTLVAAAIDRGLSGDDALGILDRIDRVGAGKTAPPLRRRVSLPPLQEPQARPHTAAARGVHGWTALLLLMAAAAGVLAVGILGFTLPEPAVWPIFSETSSNASLSAVPVAPEPLPLPGATEAFLSRARALYSTGRLRDALNEIDRVPIGDPLRREAERLRADIQRQLLAVAAADQAAAASGDSLPAPNRPE
jgi:tetratricopeptide (TPR) repeat protein